VGTWGREGAGGRLANSVALSPAPSPRCVSGYVLQHPERNQFEWDPTLNINHSSSAVRAMQYMGGFFVDQARQNQNQFASQAELDSYLIYNFQPSAGSSSYEMYTFPF
jgi:hypothetical protein